MDRYKLCYRWFVTAKVILVSSGALRNDEFIPFEIVFAELAVDFHLSTAKQFVYTSSLQTEHVCNSLLQTAMNSTRAPQE